MRKPFKDAQAAAKRPAAGAPGTDPHRGTAAVRERRSLVDRPRDVAQHPHPAAGLLHHPAADHLVQGVVPSLDQHVGEQLGHEGLDAGPGEQGDGVHVREGAQQGGPVLLRHQGPPLPLQPAHAVVVVETDGEQVAEGPRLLQVLHVAAVQQVEAAVGEDHDAALAPAAGAQVEQGGAGEQFLGVHGRIK